MSWHRRQSDSTLEGQRADRLAEPLRMLAHRGDCDKKQQPADDADLAREIGVIRHRSTPQSLHEASRRSAFCVAKRINLVTGARLLRSLSGRGYFGASPV